MRPRRILAVLGTGDDRLALETADAMARRHGAALFALTAVEPPHDLGVVARMLGREAESLMGDLIEKAHGEMAATLAEHLPGRTVETEAVVGKRFVEIIRSVQRHHCDVVVKVAEPLAGLQRFLFASTDQHLLRKCPAAVWLQTPHAPVQPERVLATVDLDTWDAAEPETLMDLNRRVIDAARAIAAREGGEVTVLHAWDAIGEGMVWTFSGTGDARVAAEAYVNEVMETRRTAMRRLLDEVDDGGAGPKLVPRMLRGTPEGAIEEACRAHGIEAVVMGTVARTGFSGVFIGNTAENIINTLTRPVLAVKPDGFVSPLG